MFEIKVILHLRNGLVINAIAHIEVKILDQNQLRV